MRYNIEIKKEELSILKEAVSSYTKMVFDTLKEQRKEWFESKALMDEVVKCIDIKDKLDRVRPVIRKDNLTFYGNFEDKEDMETFYKTQ